MPGAKMELADYIWSHPKPKAKKVSAYDEEFVFDKLDIILASANSLNLNSCQSAPHLPNLLELHDPSSQIKPNSEPAIKSINTISTFATRSHTHELYLSPAPQNQFTNTSYNFISSKYAYPAPNIPFKTTLAKQSTL